MPLVEFPSNGSSANGYLAVPESGSGPATIVLQEWWGVDDHVRSICDRLAADDFVALAPDLYHGETTTQPDEAQQKMMALDMDRAVKEMSGAVDFLATHEANSVPGKVGSVGFCLGGGLSVWAASVNSKIAATVSYYYVMPHGKPDFSNVKAPVLGHFGTADDFVSVEAAQSLEQEMRDAGVDVTFDFYDGAGHAFFNDTDRMGTYDRDAAERSWQRTTGFLREHLNA